MPKVFWYKIPSLNDGIESMPARESPPLTLYPQWEVCSSHYSWKVGPMPYQGMERPG